MTDDESYPSAFAFSQEARPYGSRERCPVCQHEFHGLPCQTHLPIGGGTTAPCMCPGGQP